MVSHSKHIRGSHSRKLDPQQEPSAGSVRRGAWVAWSAGILSLGCLGTLYSCLSREDSLEIVNIGSQNPASLVADLKIPSHPVDATAEELRAETLRLSESMLQRYPKVPEALHVAALIYADLQNTKEAEKLWHACLAMTRQQPGPYIGLARVTMDLGRDDEAVEILGQALAAGCSTAELHGQLAAALTKLGRLEEAAAEIQKGLALSPHLAENWLQLGQIQNQLGQFAEAERSLERAIVEGAKSETVYFALATACARQGKTDNAAQHRQQFTERQAARIAHTDSAFQIRYESEMTRIASSALCRASAVHDQQGAAEAAESLLIRAMQLAPSDPIVWNELALFYRRSGRLANARVAQQQLVQLDPQHVPHHLNLASLSQQSGDLPAAEVELKQLIQRRPELAVGHCSLARVYLQGGKFQQACDQANLALRRPEIEHEDALTALLILIAGHQGMGDLPSARSAYRKARDLAPDDPRLRQSP